MSDRFDQLDDALLAMMRRVCDGSASPADDAEFEKRLLADATARAYYMRLLQLDAAMQWEHAPRKSDRGTRNAEASKPSARPASAGRRPRHEIPNAYVYATATLVAIATVIVGIYPYVSSLPHSETPDPTSTAPLATLIEATEGAQLTTPGGFISEGRDYPRGEYTLSGGGTAEFMLTNSVNVKLRGETRMHMRNDMNVALTRGSANFVVPKDATGFTVHLPDKSKIVDLGTAFEVEIDDGGRATLRVATGSVRWIPADDDAASTIVTAGHEARFVDDRTDHDKPVFVVQQMGVVAYAITTEVRGNQEYSGALGLNFEVVDPIEITRLGAFDSDADGLRRPITVTIWSRDVNNTPADPHDDTGIERLATLTFESGDEDDLVGSYRFKRLPQSVVLPAGHYTVAAAGYGPGEPNLNINNWTNDRPDHAGRPPIVSDDGDGAIRFVQRGRYSDDPDTFPDVLATQRIDLIAAYGAGTFQYRLSTGSDAPDSLPLTPARKEQIK